jgi:MFS transporter, DHA1 family, multidrug resistance protein
VTEPSIETFRALAVHQGLELSEERLAQAVATHAGLRPGLEALRDVPLSFLEPVLEPATALRWIERGGRSA